ncbi:AsmA family protein [Marinimicrobium alkaliphilum]|uniref:AsmA family protein n=1 Tax=Marinimicrobium alkaliphilum TaxID=2202654 RepID=UPI000DB95580|nr:AsmA family protein [Marinimicrobium alkaliphilum]
MKKSMRRMFLIVAALVALVGAGVVWLLLDADRLGDHLETRIGDALNMDVQLGQPPTFGLVRGASVSLAEVELRREGQVVATVESAHLRIALFSLLAGKVRPLELHLERPRLSVERFSPGVFNVYDSEAETGPLNGLSLRRLRVSDARLSYLDQPSDLEWQFEHCDVDLRDIRHAGGESVQVRTTLAAEGELSCKRLSQGQLEVSGLALEIHGEDGVFDLVLDSAAAFEGQASAQLNVDLTPDSPAFSLTSSLDQFEIGAFMAMVQPQQSTHGTLDFALDVSAQGRAWQDIRSSAEGSLRLKAGELVLDGFDLDDELDDYTETQSFNLTDVGAMFLVGPIGLVASRGYAFTGLLEDSDGSTRIDQLESEWAIEDGVARARDVALRTPKNRLALTGGLDFAQYRFDELRVAVLDADGCAIVEQRVTGPFREPEVRQPNFLVVAAGPLLDLVERGIQAITDEDCDAFYSGSVPHPE